MELERRLLPTVVVISKLSENGRPLCNYSVSSIIFVVAVVVFFSHILTRAQYLITIV